MKFFSALFLALFLLTISTVEVPQKYRSQLCHKPPNWSDFGRPEEIRKRLVAPVFLLFYNVFTLSVWYEVTSSR